MFKNYKGYVIQNGEGLYSSGGSSPKFTELGKIWRTIGQLKNHLAMFKTYDGANHVPKDWKVIEIQLLPSKSIQNAHELAQAGAQKTAERMKGYTSKYAKQQADDEKRLLKKLKEKYE